MKKYCFLLLGLLHTSCYYKVVKEYYDTGEPMIEFETINFKRHGYFIYYYKNGTPKMAYHNSQGIRHGNIFQFCPSGEVEYEGIMDQGRYKTRKYFDKEGVLLSIFANGKRVC